MPNLQTATENFLKAQKALNDQAAAVKGAEEKLKAAQDNLQEKITDLNNNPNDENAQQAYNDARSEVRNDQADLWKETAKVGGYNGVAEKFLNALQQYQTALASQAASK